MVQIAAANNRQQELASTFLDTDLSQRLERSWVRLRLPPVLNQEEIGLSQTARGQNGTSMSPNGLPAAPNRANTNASHETAVSDGHGFG